MENTCKLEDPFDIFREPNKGNTPKSTIPEKDSKRDNSHEN